MFNKEADYLLIVLPGGLFAFYAGLYVVNLIYGGTL